MVRQRGRGLGAAWKALKHGPKVVKAAYKVYNAQDKATNFMRKNLHPIDAIDATVGLQNYDKMADFASKPPKSIGAAAAAAALGGVGAYQLNQWRKRRAQSANQAGGQAPVFKVQQAMLQKALEAKAAKKVAQQASRNQALAVSVGSIGALGALGGATYALYKKKKGQPQTGGKLSLNKLESKIHRYNSTPINPAKLADMPKTLASISQAKRANNKLKLALALAATSGAAGLGAYGVKKWKNKRDLKRLQHKNQRGGIFGLFGAALKGVRKATLWGAKKIAGAFQKGRGHPRHLKRLQHKNQRGGLFELVTAVKGFSNAGRWGMNKIAKKFPKLLQKGKGHPGILRGRSKCPRCKNRLPLKVPTNSLDYMARRPTMNQRCKHCGIIISTNKTAKLQQRGRGHITDMYPFDLTPYEHPYG